jgi:LacI family transcriptional regulator
VVSLSDVAARAGVSPSTVRRAIREPALVSPATLARVLAVVAELGYEPNETAGALRRGRNRAIGLIVGDILGFFFAALTRAVGRATRAAGFSLLIADNEYRADVELADLRAFNSHRISGLILRSAYGSGNYDYLRRMAERGTVIVEIDYFHPHSPFHHVMLDNASATAEGVRYLRDLGHERIAGVGLEEGVRHPDERTDGFVAAARSAGLALHDAWNPKVVRSGAATADEHAYQATRRALLVTPRPTAIFALTGGSAVGALRALQDLRVAVPGEVSLLGFDHDRWTTVVTPPLDVLEQPIGEMGRTAVEIVLDALARPCGATVRRRFQARLVMRGSCGPPADRRR